MDSGSHFLFGLTLAGLATIDPAVVHDPILAKTIIIGTVLGSTAPDFDVITRLKSYVSYVRHHRGITHSIPALFIWPVIIAISLTSWFHLSQGIASLYFWIFVAVFFHILLDVLNSYGVQCFRPFNKKWIHLDILCIFDPCLFFLHAGGTIGWFFIGYRAEIMFPWIYAITFVYIGARTWQNHCFRKLVLISLGMGGICQVIPSFHWFHWRFVLETQEAFYTGKIAFGSVEVHDLYFKENYSREEIKPIFEATMGLDGVQTFLYFAQRIHVSCKTLQDGYKVSFSDVRFWYDRRLPFGVDIHLDKELNVVNYTFGWRKRVWNPPYV